MFYQTFTGLRLPGSTPVFRFHPRSFFLLVLSALLSVVSLKAATLPSGFTESMVAGGISSPTAMSFAPDGRLFVCQQTGQLRVIKNGSLLASPFLTVTVDSAGERGLLGIAFDPNFASNQFVYIYYTVPGAPPHNRVSHFTANGDVVLAGSELPLLELNNLSSATNHNGGALHFGLDGKLYIAVGENANSANSQTLTNLLGKILRLNSDGTIPNDNPFFNQATGSNRAIWALGLRNPFTFAVQPGSGRSFINDVGQSAREEINLGVAGSNYGCRPAKAHALQLIRISAIRSTFTRTRPAIRRAVPSPAERFPALRRCSFQALMPANISLPSSAPAGSITLTRIIRQRVIRPACLRPDYHHRLICRPAPTAVFITSSAAAPGRSGGLNTRRLTTPMVTGFPIRSKRMKEPIRM